MFTIIGLTFSFKKPHQGTPWVPIVVCLAEMGGHFRSGEIQRGSKPFSVNSRMNPLRDSAEGRFSAPTRSDVGNRSLELFFPTVGSTYRKHELHRDVL